MTINEIYKEAKDQKATNAILLIEFLVFEKRVLALTDDIRKLQYYTQEKFKKKMDEHLQLYEVKRNGEKTAV